MEQVTNAILNAAQLHNKLTGEPVSEDFIKQIRRFGAGLFRLVVMGEIKKGKSSFINAFLGVKDLVPVASDIATSTVFKIHYGEEAGYRVFFEKSTGKAPIRIGANELNLYGTENGNPGNAKQVDFIEVIHPAHLLKTGLVIIDTPGLGGLFKEHKKITWNYVPKADAVFFVTDSVESPIGMEEIEHLNTVRKITPHLYFIQTKASAVDKEAREARRQHNLNILSNAFSVPAEKIPYFVVDSLRKFSADKEESVKKLERSGYPELMQFINGHLLSQKHRILAKKAIAMATPMIEAISNNIETRKTTLAADTKEKQDEARRLIADAEKDLQQWQTIHQQELRTRLDRNFQQLRSECEKQCALLSPNGVLYHELDNTICSQENIDDLGNCLVTIHNKLPETAAGITLDIRRSLENGVASILSELAAETNTEKTALRIGSESQQEESIQAYQGKGNALVQVLQNMENNNGFFKYAQAGAIGAGVGSSAGALIGGIAGSIIPGLGNAVGAAIGFKIGAFIGGAIAGHQKSEQDLQTAKMQASGAVTKMMASMQQELMSTIKDLITHFQNTIVDSINSALRQRSQELQKAKADITARASMSVNSLNEAKTKLAGEEMEFRAIMKAVEPWM